MPFPLPPGMVIAAAIAVVMWAHGWKTGWTQHEARTEKARQVAEATLAKVVKRQKEIKEVVVYQYVDRWRTVVEKGDTIVREVPVYVTKEADARCTLTRGFVGVHDAAARGESLRAPTGNPDAPAEGLTASAVARTVAGNYTTCHATAEQLRALQEWVRESSLKVP